MSAPESPMNDEKISPQVTALKMKSSDDATLRKTSDNISNGQSMVRSQRSASFVAEMLRYRTNHTTNRDTTIEEHSTQSPITPPFSPSNSSGQKTSPQHKRERSQSTMLSKMGDLHPDLRISCLSERVSELEQELEETTTNLAIATQYGQQLLDERQEMDEQLEYLNEELSKSTLDFSNLSLAHSTLTQHFKEEQMLHKDTHKLLEGAQHETWEYSERNVALQQHIDTLNEKIAQMNAREDEQEWILKDRVQTEVNEKISTATDTYAEELSNITKTMDTLTSENEDLVLNNRLLNTKLRKIERSKTMIESEFEELQQSMMVLSGGESSDASNATVVEHPDAMSAVEEMTEPESSIAMKPAVRHILSDFGALLRKCANGDDLNLKHSELSDIYQQLEQAVHGDNNEEPTYTHHRSLSLQDELDGNNSLYKLKMDGSDGGGTYDHSERSYSEINLHQSSCEPRQDHPSMNSIVASFLERYSNPNGWVSPSLSHKTMQLFEFHFNPSQLAAEMPLPFLCIVTRLIGHIVGVDIKESDLTTKTTTEWLAECYGLISVGIHQNKSKDDIFSFLFHFLSLLHDKYHHIETSVLMATQSSPIADNDNGCFSTCVGSMMKTLLCYDSTPVHKPSPKPTEDRSDFTKSNFLSTKKFSKRQCAPVVLPYSGATVTNEDDKQEILSIQIAGAYLPQVLSGAPNSEIPVGAMTHNVRSMSPSNGYLNAETKQLCDIECTDAQPEPVSPHSTRESGKPGHHGRDIIGWLRYKHTGYHKATSMTSPIDHHEEISITVDENECSLTTPTPLSGSCCSIPQMHTRLSDETHDKKRMVETSESPPNQINFV